MNKIAQVQMETVDFENELFQKDLKDLNIETKQLDNMSPSGYDLFLYSGGVPSLRYILKHWFNLTDPEIIEILEYK